MGRVARQGHVDHGAGAAWGRRVCSSSPQKERRSSASADAIESRRRPRRGARAAGEGRVVARDPRLTQAPTSRRRDARCLRSDRLSTPRAWVTAGWRRARIR
jgi:hypothetical protein